MSCDNVVTTTSRAGNHAGSGACGVQGSNGLLARRGSRSSVFRGAPLEARQKVRAASDALSDSASRLTTYPDHPQDNRREQ